MSYVLGIIPARGGSKRLPRKNLLPLAGKPLIYYTVEAGLLCHCIDELIVSTDDDEIARISLEYGANVPFMRPANLALDDTSSFDVVRHALNYYRTVEKRLFEYVILLQPTSPLRDWVEIDKAMEFLHSKNADAVISVCETDHSPLWCSTLSNNLSMNTFLREDVKKKRSQDLEKYYRLNGAIYICNTLKLLEEETFFLRERIYAYIMPREKSIDIDNKIDLMLCNTLMNDKVSDDIVCGHCQ